MRRFLLAHLFLCAWNGYECCYDCGANGTLMTRLSIRLLLVRRRAITVTGVEIESPAYDAVGNAASVDSSTDERQPNFV